MNLNVAICCKYVSKQGSFSHISAQKPTCSFYLYFNKYSTHRIHLSFSAYPPRPPPRILCCIKLNDTCYCKQTIQPNEARLKHSNCVLCNNTSAWIKTNNNNGTTPLATKISIQHCFVRFLSSHKYFVDLQCDISFCQALWWLFAFKIQDVSTCLKVKFRSNTSMACSH